MTLEEALEEAARLAASDHPDSEERLAGTCAGALAEAAGGGETLQVAVMRLLDGEEFAFAWPRELRAGNRFPAGPSLAGRALRAGALIENAVPRRAHFALYERIPREGVSPEPIQRMLALPIPGPDGPVGVAEISRIGETPEAAGPPFSGADAERVTSALAVLGPLLARVWEAHSG